MIDIKQLNEEITLKEDECCIVFDLGCYFPYRNQEILKFDFSLGEEKFDDYKHNYRYPNGGYKTISRKYGRKVSKVGYPYVMKLNEQSPMLLCVKVGIKDQHMTLVFPIITQMTKEKPICVLSLHYLFDENEFTFYSYERIKKGCWHQYRWLSHKKENDDREFDVVMDCHRIEDSYTLIYDTIITPYSLPKDA